MCTALKQNITKNNKQIKKYSTFLILNQSFAFRFRHANHVGRGDFPSPLEMDIASGNGMSGNMYFDAFCNGTA